MKQIISDFINYIKFIEQLSTNTIDGYQSDLNIYLNFCEENAIDYQEISHNQLSDFLSESTRSNASLSRMVSSLRRFYSYLKVNRIIHSDPTQFLSIKSKKQRLPKYLTLDEFKQLISFPFEKEHDYLDRALIEMIYGSGLRVSECISLQAEHYFAKERLLRVLGKGQKIRIVPLSSASIEAFNEYVQNARNKWLTRYSDMLFVNHLGKPLNRHYVYNMLQRRKQQTGLIKPISPHILRHSFASELINHGADLRVIQELLGHSDVSTTEIYTHIDSGVKQKQYQKYHPGQSIKSKGEHKDE